MVKLGQLFLDGGQWEGKQIVPKEWVDEATTQQIEADNVGYGYQWWTEDLDGDRSFQAVGDGGQTIVVVPSRDLVVSATTELRANDATSRGIDNGVLQAIIEDVVSHFPPTN
jgi:CubicO group peptidase (beta-lactamase class C family)